VYSNLLLFTGRGRAGSRWLLIHNRIDLTGASGYVMIELVCSSIHNDSRPSNHTMKPMEEGLSNAQGSTISGKAPH